MKGKMGQGGFTLPEIMIVSALIFIALAAILNTYFYGQRYFQAGTFQIIAEAYGRKAMRRISNDIRRAQATAIFANYGPILPLPIASGNYLTLDLPTNPDVGYYLNNQGEIRYVDNLATDNTSSQNDDEVIATNITGNKIFVSSSGGLIIINFNTNLTGTLTPGRQAVEIRTKADPRN